MNSLDKCLSQLKRLDAARDKHISSTPYGADVDIRTMIHPLMTSEVIDILFMERLNHHDFLRQMEKYVRVDQFASYLHNTNTKNARKMRRQFWQTRRNDLYRNDEHIGRK